jgi:hypothetical protein
MSVKQRHNPCSRPFNRSPGLYPGVRRANLSVAELPTAWCSISELRRPCIMRVSIRKPSIKVFWMFSDSSPNYIMRSYLLCSVCFINLMKGRGRVVIAYIYVRHDSESLRIRSVCRERFVIPSDLSRHRYIVALSHLETPVQRCSASDSTLSTWHEILATCICLFAGQYSGPLQKLCSNCKCYK